jgi:hypothetical protein
MDFSEVINSLPLWVSGLIFLVLAVGVVPGVQLAIRRRYGLEALTVNNEVAGFKYAVIGVVYAVLLVFIMVAVWEEWRNAKSFTDQEASALIDLYRLSSGLHDDVNRTALRDSILQYASVVINDEWPALARGEANPAAQAALTRLFDVVLSATQAGRSLETIREPAIGLLIKVADNRLARLDNVEGVIPSILWGVVLIGGVATLSFTWFFGNTNARAQAVMTAMLSLMILSIIYVSALLDHPFAGAVSITPKPFQHIIGSLK